MENKGIKSTEFWLTASSVLVGTFLFVTGKIDTETWKNLLMTVVPGYSIARGISKISK